MKLVADEGVDRQIVERLRQDGHEVVYVAELDPGIGDALVLQRADEGGALLLTGDKDFGELVFRQRKANRGVVLLRLGGWAPERKAVLVSESLREHGGEMRGAFSVVSPTALRIRRELPS